MKLFDGFVYIIVIIFIYTHIEITQMLKGMCFLELVCFCRIQPKHACRLVQTAGRREEDTGGGEC